MVEAQKTEETQQAKTAAVADSNNRVLTQNPSIVDTARIEREKLEATLKKREELLEREERLYANKLMDGKSPATMLNAPNAPVKLTPVEYAKKVWRGEANPLKDDGFI